MSFAAFLIVLSATVSAIGQIFLKIGVNSPSKLNRPEQVTGQLTTLWLTLITPGVIAGLGFYAAGTIWLSALAQIEISRAYPFVGIGFMLTTLAGSRSLRIAIRGNAAQCCAYVIQSMEVP
jgi:hypothetical protein